MLCTCMMLTRGCKAFTKGAEQASAVRRGKVVQIGTPEELQSAPATPFVLHFIDDVNQMPANCQFVRRMGYKTEKPYVMCRPTVFNVRPSALSLLIQHPSLYGHCFLCHWLCLQAMQ